MRAWLAAALCVGCASPPRAIAPGFAIDVPLPASAQAEEKPPTHPSVASSSGLPDDVVDSIGAAVREAIDEAKIPGCVVAIGRHDRLLFVHAYGSRSVSPGVEPMTEDTAFDLASLTKPVATAASILVLEDRGRLSLEDPLGKYLPELGPLGAGTLRQVLTHTAGLPVETPLGDYRSGIDEALHRIARVKPRAPGEETRYSDVGFILLGEVVRRVSGQDLATFARQAIYEPLGMRDTSFRPDPALVPRIAPTENVDGVWLRGTVHDPRARALGGVAGNAGLFSTAKDLARFAEALLGGPSFLTPRALSLFTAPHDEPGAVRALGWDVRSPYSTNRGASLSPRAFGHGGYTGTSLWIDPTKDLFVVVLSNRVHPNGHGAVNPLAGRVADLAAQVVGQDERLVVAACGEPVRDGIDVLAQEGFARLRGAHVGLITNGAARAADGRRVVDVLHGAPGVDVVRLFTPEHGMTAKADAPIHDGVDETTRLPITSLYGTHFAPTDADLAGIDTLVFDLPDVGVRFFTYASTLHAALAVAATHRLKFLVLDRPDPLGGERVEGPILEGRRSFVNHAALPVVHGMTMGELAWLFDAEDHLGTALDVVRVRGWRREQTAQDTGFPWVPPSPNLHSVLEAALYPAVGLLESTNVSVGRGTDTPFEVLGAPWIKGEDLAAVLSEMRIAGVRVEPATFTPSASKHKGSLSGGVRFTLTDARAFSPMRLGIALAVALHRLYPAAWDEAELAHLLGSPRTMAAIHRGAGVDEVLHVWDAELARFIAKRASYLLYGSVSCGGKVPPA